jgi:hypothetical protein
MALTALTPEKMEKDIASMLEEGEYVIGAAFGQRVPTKEKSKKILTYGLIVFGLLLLIMMQDKVYLVVTNKRLLVLILLDRIYKVSERESYGRDQVTAFLPEKGSMYHNIDLTVAGKDMRFKCFPQPMGLPQNGAQVEAICKELAQG